jgi:hypothetical protein
VDWPDSSHASTETFKLGILGADPFTPGLRELLEGKSVNGRPIEVHRLTSAVDAQAFHVIWVSASESRNLSEILSVLNGVPVLTVSDIDDFMRRGGMIGFEMEGRRVRFNVNLAAADRAGLKISSEVLKLAKRVRGGVRTTAWLR